MAFSSPSFLFAFLPVFFLVYYAAPSSWRNLTLLLGSLLFYVTGASYAFFVLVLSIPLNHYLAILLSTRRGTIQGRALLILGIVLNLAPLFIYKYLGFFATIGADASMAFGYEVRFNVPQFLLPAGISFFTFQGLSYIVDVYQGATPPAKRIIDFGMYHTSFPQLIAGPIVRYVEIERQVIIRPLSADAIQSGILLFCFGLARKIVLGDNMGAVADKIFALPADQLTTSLAWLGTVTYTLQIYLDFSGYSQMAIGLGLMLGFTFPPNFNQPYRASSITEFWRRWHMTLSRWFRDYVYIPLGGNRAGPVRTYFNLGFVFLLCGLWHGAAYTFVAWGAYHGALLIIERLLKNLWGFDPKGWIGWGVTFVLVMIGWVFFRADTMAHAFAHLRAMAGGGGQSGLFDVMFYMTTDKIVFLVVSVAIALVPVEWFRTAVPGHPPVNVLTATLALTAFVYSTAMIAANGFNPFIYFRF